MLRFSLQPGGAHDLEPAGRVAALALASSWGRARRVRPSSSFDDLLANLKSPNAKTRQEAAAELGKSRRREAVAPLVRPGARPRGQGAPGGGARPCARCATSQAVPALVTSLQDGDPEIREEAIGTLVEIYAERERGGPVDRLPGDVLRRVRPRLGAALHRRRPDGLRGASPERAAGREDRPSGRTPASPSASSAGGARCADLQAALQDPEAEVRGAAATAIGKVGTAEDGKALIPLLADELGDVRNRALQAIGVLRVRDAGPALREMFEQNRARELGHARARLPERGSATPPRATSSASCCPRTTRSSARLAVEGLGRIADASMLPAFKKDYQREKNGERPAGLQLRARPARATAPSWTAIVLALGSSGSLGDAGAGLHPGAGSVDRAGPLPLPERPGRRGPRRRCATSWRSSATSPRSRG